MIVRKSARSPWNIGPGDSSDGRGSSASVGAVAGPKRLARKPLIRPPYDSTLSGSRLRLRQRVWLVEIFDRKGSGWRRGLHFGPEPYRSCMSASPSRSARSMPRFACRRSCRVSSTKVVLRRGNWRRSQLSENDASEPIQLEFSFSSQFGEQHDRRN